MDLAGMIDRLRKIDKWRLGEAEWRLVRDVLGDIDTALTERDEAKAWEALARLEPLEDGGPRRAKGRLGSAGEAIPAERLEQWNHLIERLTADPGPAVPHGEPPAPQTSE